MRAKSRLQLTLRGRAVFDPLDRAARLQIAEMIAPMTLEQRSVLLSAMQSVQRLLEAGSKESAREPYTIRPLKVGDIGWITHRQGILYSQEYGWDATYEALVAEILAGFVKNFDSAMERGLGGGASRRGSSALYSWCVHRLTWPKLRLLYVEPTARGLRTRQASPCRSASISRGRRDTRH